MAACSDSADANANPNPPDALLRERLGLDDEDRVLRVQLGSRENVEQVIPAVTQAPAGAFVEFATMDGRVHTVSLVLDSLTAGQVDFLRRTNQLASPPLLRFDSRFVVDFRGAPAGTYPYLVEGNGDSAMGMIRIAPAGPR